MTLPDTRNRMLGVGGRSEGTLLFYSRQGPLGAVYKQCQPGRFRRGRG